MISPRSYVPIPTPVEAVQVTAENAAEVVEWAHWTDPPYQAPWRRQGDINVGCWVVMTPAIAFTLTDDEFRRRYQPAKADQ